MKAYWFAFNPSDWLSAKSVRMMSLAERGAYIGLLATAWGEDRPGTLPAAEDTVRRLAEMSPADWAISGPCLLAMFPLSECGTFRYNPRLLEEAGKREELCEKKAEAGRRSAAKRAALSTQGQQEGNTIPTPVENPATGVGEKGNQLQSQLQLQAKAVGAPADSLPAADNRKASARRSAVDSGAETYPAEASPLYKPEPLHAYYTELVKLLPGLDWGWYVAEMRLKAPTDALTAPQWRNWIINFVKNEGATYRRVVVPLPNQIASNAAFVAPPSLGIPNKYAYLKPVTSQPAGQYSGTIQ